MQHYCSGYSCALPKNKLEGEIIYIDRFGNALTSVAEKALPSQNRSKLRVELTSRKCRPIPWADFYAAVPSGSPLALLGSSGFVEIAINGGRAAEELRLSVGDPISVHS